MNNAPSGASVSHLRVSTRRSHGLLKVSPEPFNKLTTPF